MEATHRTHLLTLSPQQAAYAEARTAYDAAKRTAETTKATWRIEAKYAAAESEREIDSIAALEADAEHLARLPEAERALRAATERLIAWGIGRACAVGPEHAATLRDLQARAKVDVVAREKIAALCMRLAA